MCGVGIYIANKRLNNKLHLCIFAVLLLVFLSAGLFTGGCYNIGNEIGDLKVVWKIEDEFWSVQRLPMTILKPFGYNDTRTVLEIVCYWSWLALSALLHFRKYRISPRLTHDGENGEAPITRESSGLEDFETVEMGEASTLAHSLATWETNVVREIEIGND